MYSTPAIKPIDVPNYGENLAAAGQGVAHIAGAVTAGLAAVDKEKKRQELLVELKQQKPFLEVDDNIPFDELARGLHQINQVSLRYDLAQKAGARLPDEKQMYKAAFHSDEKSVEKLASVLDELGKVASTEKFKQETEQQKEARSAEQSKLMSDYMQANPEATREQAYQSISQGGFSAEAAGAQGMEFTRGMAQSETEKQRLDIALKNLKVNQAKAKQYLDRVGADKFFSDSRAVDASLTGYASVYDKVEEYEKNAQNRDLNKEKAKADLAIKGASVGEDWDLKYDQATLKLRKMADQLRKVATTKRSVALSSLERFDQMYPGARETDLELEQKLHPFGEEDNSASSQPKSAPAPASGGGGDWTVINGIKVRKKK